ncbi:glycosyltransferase family 4 protein [Hymenobacter elongatus]|uniref:Glycosyltransferase n=1 Tax=Hymenobacter elongatus TaxID=877208 RepID=A0A4Z0PFY0_9BACT|nr:glycosyltransferase family 4 protein [Hymenobacter elongatus]TGE14039.1 glycosyltransferase [Hymenobacter elongatus]
MKVLWLAAFPAPHEAHPAPVPWIFTLAELVSRHPEVELTILNFAEDITVPVDEFDNNGIHFIYLRVPRRRHDILSLYQWRIAIMAKYLRQHYHHYDLIHLHGSELQYQVASAGLDIPQLLSVQGLVSEYAKVVPNPVSKLKFLWMLAGYYECKYMPGIAHFSCRTHWDKAHIARLNPQATIHHNWESLRSEFFAAPTPTAPSGRPQVLFLGGQQEMKGFRETLVAFDLARQRQPELKLVFGGRVNEAEVEQAVQQAGLRHIRPQDVECHGFLTADGLAQLCHESLCLLHPSYIDNSPNTICEAQVAGLPVVASNVGGVSSLIECGHTGILTDLNPRNLADKVLLLHDDPALRHRLATQAQAVAQERHNPASVLQKTLDIYHAIL